MNKKKVTFSIQESTNEKLDKLAKETGMNKSIIVSLLIEKLAKGSVKIIQQKGQQKKEKTELELDLFVTFFILIVECIIT